MALAPSEGPAGGVPCLISIFSAGRRAVVAGERAGRPSPRAAGRLAAGDVPNSPGSAAFTKPAHTPHWVLTFTKSLIEHIATCRGEILAAVLTGVTRGCMRCAITGASVWLSRGADIVAVAAWLGTRWRPCTGPAPI